MNAIQKLWAALAARLPADEVEELKAHYRADNAADSAASRLRRRERLRAAQAWREAQAAKRLQQAQENE